MSNGFSKITNYVHTALNLHELAGEHFLAERGSDSSIIQVFSLDYNECRSYKKRTPICETRWEHISWYEPEYKQLESFIYKDLSNAMELHKKKRSLKASKFVKEKLRGNK